LLDILRQPTHAVGQSRSLSTRKRASASRLIGTARA
jgi:hypothetical protein